MSALYRTANDSEAETSRHEMLGHVDGASVYGSEAVKVQKIISMHGRN